MQTQNLHLTPADRIRSPYFYVPIAVREGTTRIDGAMRYERADDSIVDLDCPASSRFAPCRWSLANRRKRHRSSYLAT